MRKFVVIALLLASLCCRAQTLRDLLASKEIPDKSFSAAELDEPVMSVDLDSARYTFVAYLKTRTLPKAGNPGLIRLDRDTGAVMRAEPQLQPAQPEKKPAQNARPEAKDQCCTSLSALRFIGDYVVLSSRLSTASTAQLFFDRNLKLLQMLYGQEMIEAAPGEIVSDREASKLKAFHAERLDLVALGGGFTQQLFPVENDRLRAAFVSDNERQMPPKSACPEADPCDPELYDETISFAGSNRAGAFAFVVNRLADHSAAGGVITAQSALYIYAQGTGGWRYCQQEIEGSDADVLDSNAGPDFKTLATRCTPDLPVVPTATKAQSAPAATAAQ